MRFAVLIFTAAALNGFQTRPAADRPPMALTELHAAAVAVWRPALVGDWNLVSSRMDSVDTAASHLPAHAGKPDLIHQLDARLKSLHRDVRGHRSVAAATDANWVARIADEIMSSYETAMPGDVRLLEFFCRAAETDAVASRRARFNTDIADLRTVWGRVEPLLLQRNATDPARRFTDAIVRLEGAKTATEQKAAAEAALAEGDDVLGVFAAPSNRASRE